MVSGSDSHGAPVVFKAEQLGIEPEELVNISHKQIVETYARLGFLYDNYTSTRTEIHKQVAQNIFLVLKERGYLNKKSSKQYYDPKVERFLPDRYVKGTCPICKNENARGDECPECGSYLEPEQLLEPYSTLSDAKPELRDTEHFYMDLRALQKPLEEWATEASKNWRKWVREFSLGWLKQGLEPRPVTRDMKFGIPVPVEGWDEKVLYVWIEAVIGYLSASIEWAEKRGEPNRWEDFWKDPKAKHFYFVAGGNVPFHTILWPAEIIAYNEKYGDKKLEANFKLPGESSDKPLQLPYDIPGNNMLFYRGRKMSKGDSTGIGVEEAIEMFGADLLRYFFIKYAPENHDREFIWKDLIDANNNELVANLGNFIYRALSFTESRFDGVVPKGELEKNVSDAIEKAFKDCGDAIEGREFVRSIECILELGKFANKYFNDREPWKSIKEDRPNSEDTIFNSIQLVNAIRLLIRPFMPFAADRIGVQLGVVEDADPNKELQESGEVRNFQDLWKFELIEVGHKLNKAEIIFTKFEYTEELCLADNPPDEVSEKAKNISLKVDTKLNNLPVKWIVYRSTVCKKLRPDQRLDLQRRVMNFIENLSPSWREEPKYKGYRELHAKYNGGEETPGSVELLIEKIMKEGQFPKINGFVDVYNMISILTGVSIGAHDIGTITGEPQLDLLEKGHDFKEIGTNADGIARAGEYAYIDDEGILCRMDIKQSQRTRVSDRSRNILTILQGHEYISEKELEEATELLTKELINYGVIEG